MTISYIGELMERRFGRGWWSGGKLDTKFVNVVTPGDHVTARAVLTDRKADGDATRAHVSAWIEKDDGTVVLVASASALEG
jgi:acyl dehydratase